MIHTAVEVTKEAALFISRLPGDTDRAGAGLRDDEDFLLGDRLLFSGDLRLLGALTGEPSEVPAFLFLVGVVLTGLPVFFNIRQQSFNRVSCEC